MGKFSAKVWWGVAAIIIGVAIWRIADVIQWAESHEKLSGWAQAVGSIIALLVAIKLPAWQDSYNRSAENSQITARIKLIAVAARDAISDLLDGSDQATANLMSIHKAKIWEDLAGRLNALPMERLTSDAPQVALLHLAIIFRDLAFIHAEGLARSLDQERHLLILRDQIESEIRDHL